MITAMFSYNQFSGGARELASTMNVPRIKHTGSKFKSSPSKVIINWGASSERFPAEFSSCSVINPPRKVDRAVDKSLAFSLMRDSGVSVPDFTSSRSTALNWLDEGIMVFARTQLKSHSGRGIVIMDPDHPETWETNAPLYVKYIPKKDEYRIHVVNGQVIDVQRKGLREEFKDQDGVNFKIRNLANGFVYVRNDGKPVPQVVLDVGLAAVQAFELDFGAADIIYNAKNNAAYALEVNCAPGLSGTTITNYANALSSAF